MLPPSQCFVNVSSEPLQGCEYGHVSFARSFAKSLLGGLPAGDAVLVVPTAIGGTGFMDGTWTAYVGSGFVRAVQRLQQAWSVATQQKAYSGYNVTFDGVLWHQGECDAGDNMKNYSATTAQYLYDDLLPLISAVRNTSYLNFSSPTLPFVCGQLLPEWVYNKTARSGVRDAIMQLPQLVSPHRHSGQRRTDGRPALPKRSG